MVGWTLTPTGVGGWICVATAFPLALLVLFARPDRVQNRALAMLLGMEGVTILGAAALLASTTDPEVAYAAQAMTFTIAAANPFVYLFFLGTLPTGLVRPFRSRLARAILVVLGVAAAVLVTVRRELVLGPIAYASDGSWSLATGSYVNVLLTFPIMVASLFGFAAAMQLWRKSAPGTAARRQGAIYAAAFGARDIGWVSYMAVVQAQLFPYTSRTFQILELSTLSLLVVFYCLVAYGILKAQMFDIDLRLKRGIGRTAVVGLVAVAFFAVNELTEGVVPVTGLWPGLLAAGFVALAFVPLQRGAFLILDRMLPQVQDSTAYRTKRKEEVYQAALDELASDGRLSPKDRAQLQRLRERLDLAA